MSRPVQVVPLDGELDMATIDEVDRALASVVVTEHLIVDLSDVSFIDSVTLSRFVQTARRHQAAGSQFVLADARGVVRRLLAITQLDTALPYADDVVTGRSLAASLDEG